MALVRIPYFGLIFRPFVKQDIFQECLIWLLGQINPERNFDGELMVLGSMSSHEIEAKLNKTWFIRKINGVEVQTFWSNNDEKDPDRISVDSVSLVWILFLNCFFL